MTRLFIASGRADGLRPQDLVGAIANEAGLPGRAVGAIDIYDRFSFVEVPDGAADRVIAALGRATLRGRRVAARRATPDRPSPSRGAPSRPRADRSASPRPSSDRARSPRSRASQSNPADGRVARPEDEPGRERSRPMPRSRRDEPWSGSADEERPARPARRTLPVRALRPIARPRTTRTKRRDS
jgi:hypothetical protein